MKTPKKWPPRLRKRRVRKFKPNLVYLEAWEEAVILRDIASFDGKAVTAKELNLKFPMRYGPRLQSVLKRMAAPETGIRTLDRRRVGIGHSAFAYSLTEHEQAKRAAA